MKCIDDNQSNRIQLSFVKDDEIYIDETPNSSARTYATLTIEPPIKKKTQKILVGEFNKYLNEQREMYNSLLEKLDK